MAYNATYDEGDMAPIVIDGIGTIFALFVGFASLIGLILLWGYVKRKM